MIKKHVQGYFSFGSNWWEIKLEISGLENPGWEMFMWEDPFTNMIPACISINIHYILWDEIVYPFANFNGGTTVEVCRLIRNFIPQNIMDVNTYTCYVII